MFSVLVVCWCMFIIVFGFLLVILFLIWKIFEIIWQFELLLMLVVMNKNMKLMKNIGRLIDCIDYNVVVVLVVSMMKLVVVICVLLIWLVSLLFSGWIRELMFVLRKV